VRALATGVLPESWPRCCSRSFHQQFLFVFPMTMHRSWIIWLTSTVTFFASVAAIVATGPNQAAEEGSSSTVEAAEEPVRLPQINAYAQDYAKYDGGELERQATDASVAQPLSAVQQEEAEARPSSSKLNLTNGGGGHAALSKSASSKSALSKSASSKSDTDPSPQAQAVVGVSYQPKEVVSLAHPTNYGERFTRDVSGSLVNNEYIAVLHETVGSASSALNTFQANNPRDEDQVSYHTLIGLDGTIYYVVPPEQRAFGAGNSVFPSFIGEESVFTNAEFPSSVNNFAYHISLETPVDGQNSNATYHSGYTEAQYQSLAWLLARTSIPDDRITTHRNVDRSRSRIDPRSFEADRMFRILRQYPSRQQAG